jgi:hypothetical protein
MHTQLYTAGRHVGDQYVRTACGTVFELGSRRAAAEETRIESLRRSLVSSAPLLAAAGTAVVVGSTLLSHHVQLSVFVV